MDDLPDMQRDVIRARYKDGCTLEETRQRVGVTFSSARTLELNALKELRKPKNKKRILPYADEYINEKAFHGNGAGRFARTWTSSTERIAIDLLEKSL